MPHSQLSVSLERNSVTIIDTTISSDFAVKIEAQELLSTDYDIYSEIFERGNSKLILDLSTRLAEKLKRFKTDKVAVNLLMNGARCLTAQVDSDLTPVDFAAELEFEAEQFLSNPADFIAQPFKLSDHSHLPFENYALAFIPKRNLTRLQLLFSPIRKEINLIDVSHFSLVAACLMSHSQFILLELEPNYLAVSVARNGEISKVGYWELQSESDAAYFALREIKAIEEIKTQKTAFPILAAGSSGGGAARAFISNAAFVDVIGVVAPKSTINNPTLNASEIKALGSALTAAKYFT
ncbi:MAG: hypothetical protein SFU91_04580 [Chloroherpetonaceae bacterium]|nr:hypothetical protein [Chloroherpetonaceae bacterium]